MKPAASPAAAVARRAARPAGGASRRKSAPETPPRRTLAGMTKMFRAVWHPEFMRHGRPDDFKETGENRR